MGSVCETCSEGSMLTKGGEVSLKIGWEWRMEATLFMTTEGDSGTFNKLGKTQGN